MNSAVLLVARRLMCCAAIIVPVVPLTTSITGAMAAQGEKSNRESKVKSDSGKSKKASLQIEVRAADSGSKQPPQPSKEAMVKIIGEEDSYTTDEKGKTQRFATMAGAKKLIVQPFGAKPCTLDVLINEGRQDLTVLVETSPKVTCTLEQNKPER